MPKDSGTRAPLEQRAVLVVLHTDTCVSSAVGRPTSTRSQHGLVLYEAAYYKASCARAMLVASSSILVVDGISR